MQVSERIIRIIIIPVINLKAPKVSWRLTNRALFPVPFDKEGEEFLPISTVHVGHLGDALDWWIFGDLSLQNGYHRP